MMTRSLIHVSLVVAVGLLLQANAGAAGWPDVVNQPGLTEEERNGARFLADHLDHEDFSTLPQGQQKILLRYAADHRDGNPELVLCWRDDTPREIVRAFHKVEEAGAKVRKESRRPVDAAPAFQGPTSNHWSRTASSGTGQQVQGQPITLRWSFVPDGTLIPGGQVSGEATNSPSNLRAWLAGLYGGSATGSASTQPWFPIFQAVFDNIASQSGVRYVYEPNDDGATLSNATSGQGVSGLRGDIRISGHTLDGNSNVLAYNYFPDFGDMVIDTADNFYNNFANGSQRLRNVVEHEHGHGLGLEHVCPVDNTKLMEPFINLGFTGAQFDDILTLQRLYGDAGEVHGSERDNDALARATPLSPAVNVPLLKEWVSIDDNGDSDHYRFFAPAGSQLTVRVVPSSRNYLEGSQDPASGNCNAGTPFDSRVVHDLSFQLIDSNQSTILSSAASQPVGGTEEIVAFALPRGDTYYLKVTGGGADFAQLYRLEIDVSTPSVALQLTSSTLVRELFRGMNGAADPGETIELAITLTNVGILGGTNFNSSLVLPPGSQGFAIAPAYGNLASGGSGTKNFIFAPSGNCGEVLDLELLVTADGGFSTAFPLKLPLGNKQISFSENFDAASTLPTDWSSAESGRGSGWSISSTSANSPANAAFASNPSQSGSSTLTSKSIPLGSSPGTFSFFQLYDTESGWDGGVLEIKIGAGSWQDILDSGATFEKGGYNLPLAGTKNPLAGRSGWSGSSGSFIETVVNLSTLAPNENVQFRWIIGHDNRVGANGWFIDDLTYRTSSCDESGIALTLSGADLVASETADLSDPAEIQVSAILPVPAPIPVALNATGTADVSNDLSGFGNLILTTGSSSVAASWPAISDGLIEGQETFRITSPDAAGSIDLTILDSPYSAWAAAELGTVGAIRPGDDFDNDGSSNVEELVFGSDARLASSRPSLSLTPSGSDFELAVPLSSLPPGVLVDAVASDDLIQWTPDRVTTLEDGFRLDSSEERGFLRLLYSVPELP